MNKYGLQGALKAQPGKGKQLAAILLEAAELLTPIEACRLYVVGQDATDEDLVWITEVWDSKEDQQDSLQMETVKALIGRAMPLMEHMPEKGLEMDILGGKGIA